MSQNSSLEPPLPLSSQPAVDRSRPHTTAVLAMSADGKIADAHHGAARFPSPVDKAHLEVQVAKADATLFGAGTLRAYGTTLPVTNPELIAQRRSRHQLDQPSQIVCSATGNLDPHYRFFQQPVPRWLITTPAGWQTWQAHPNQAFPAQNLFDQILINPQPWDWVDVMQALRTGKAAAGSAGTVPAAKTTAAWLSQRPPIERLVIMGGGELVASLLADDLIDELYLTICPLLIGGKTAPTPVGGLGFGVGRSPGHATKVSPQLKLQSARVEGDEVFLHYTVMIPRFDEPQKYLVHTYLAHTYLART